MVKDAAEGMAGLTVL
jgi:hypothetical protein